MIVYFEKWTRRYWPTQDDAKAAAREARVGGGEAAGFAKVDVPTTEGRDALCEFLNNLEDAARLAAGAEPEAALPTPQPVEAPAPSPAVDQQAVWTATDIEDFILNRATVNQASNIMSCLGTRFAELIKEKR